MKPRQPTPTRVACEVCGKSMKLARTTPVPARSELYEFWNCEACGHTHLRATQIEKRTD
jgi:transcription elongation factor Elf1